MTSGRFTRRAECVKPTLICREIAGRAKTTGPHCAALGCVWGQGFGHGMRINTVVVAVAGGGSNVHKLFPRPAAASTTGSGNSRIAAPAASTASPPRAPSESPRRSRHAVPVVSGADSRVLQGVGERCQLGFSPWVNGVRRIPEIEELPRMPSVPVRPSADAAAGTVLAHREL